MSSETFNEGQQIALGLTAVVSGTLSIVGSSFIVCIILKDRREKLKKTYHRLLLGLSISDISSSTCYVLNVFFSPSGTPGVWQAHGNQRTCTALGFFAQLGFMSTLYSSSLALYYYLRIRSKTAASSGSSFHRIEPVMHVVSVGYPLLTALAGVFLELYNPLQLGVGCWISAYPWGCLEDETIECTRGENADFYVYPFGGILVILGYVVVVSCMMAIYCTIRKQINVMRTRYGIDARQALSEASTHRLRETAHQAILYCAAFILATVWTGVARIVENESANGTMFAIALCSQVFYPLQGAFNVFIFIRPRYIALRRSSPRASSWELLKRIILEMDVERSTLTGRHRPGFGSETRYATSRSGASRGSRFSNVSESSALAFSASNSGLMTSQDLYASEGPTTSIASHLHSQLVEDNNPSKAGLALKESVEQSPTINGAAPAMPLETPEGSHSATADATNFSAADSSDSNPDISSPPIQDDSSRHGELTVDMLARKKDGESSDI